MKFLKKNFLFLAPMSGYSNGACRKIFMEYGADGAVSEFVYSRAVLTRAPRIFERMRFGESERPCGIQIFGSDPFEMAEAAALIEETFAPDFIDINCGCPAPNATSAGAGSALLKNPRLMCEIVRKVSETLKKTPATAKVRSGWDKNSIILPDAARALEQAGAKMLTVHGRTKSAGYEGDADWNLIETCAKAVFIPVIGNGSVEKRSGEELRNSACAGFMVGRAALGNPWIFPQLKAKISHPDLPVSEPSPSERAKLALRYAELAASGAHSGIDAENLKFAKTQIMRFLKTASGFKKLRVGMKNVNTLEELKELLCEHI